MIAAGTRLGSYIIEAPLGAGGMGEVYRARDTRLQRDVALKILPEVFASDPDRLARFEREARMLATLNHPNIAQIHGLEESAGVRALVMELVPGRTLDEILRRQASLGMATDQALAIARQMADALEAAHEAGIVHRDLKPANVKVRVDPNSVNALVFFGFDRCLAGRTDESLALLDRAVRLDPLSTVPLYTRELCPYAGHRFDEVIVANRKTREIDPKFWYLESWVGAARRELGDYQGALKEYGEAEANSGGEPQYGLALTYGRMGRPQDAREILRRLDERARTRYVPYWFRAAVRGSLGDMDEAVALLQRAFDTRESWMPAARQLPELAALAKDPRAERIVKAVDAVQQSAGGQAGVTR